MTRSIDNPTPNFVVAQNPHADRTAVAGFNTDGQGNLNPFGIRAALTSSNLATFMNKGLCENSASGGFSWHETVDLPFVPLGVKVRLFNSALTPMITVKGIVGNSDVAVDGAASSYTMQNVVNITVAGATTFTIPAATGVVPNIVPGFVDSDVLPMTRLAKAGGGVGSFFMARMYWSDAAGTRLGAATSVNATLAASGSIIGFQAGDAVTTPGNFNAPTIGQIGPCMRYQFWVPQTIEVQAGFGDSITMGTTDQIKGRGWVGRVNKSLRALGRNVSLANHGWAGQTTDAYNAIALANISVIRPKVATYSVWSPNDTDRFTQAGNDRRMFLVARFLDECNKYGTIPVLTTPIPTITAANAAQENIRRAMTTFVKSMPSIPQIDLDGLLTSYNGAGVGSWANTALTDDNVHPNGAVNGGYDVIETIATPVISPFFSTQQVAG